MYCSFFQEPSSSGEQPSSSVQFVAKQLSGLVHLDLTARLKRDSAESSLCVNCFWPRMFPGQTNIDGYTVMARERSRLQPSRTLGAFHTLHLLRRTLPVIGQQNTPNSGI